MQNLTLVIAVTLSIFVFVARPIYGLIAYAAAVIFFWPLSMMLGPLHFTMDRIVILPLFANIFLKSDLVKDFRFSWPDKLMILFFTGQVLAGTTTNPNLSALLENRAGRFFDVALPYFAVRLIITNRQKCLFFLKSVLFFAAILAIPAFYESLTGHNVLAFGRLHEAEQRMGFYRAAASFKHPIYLGVFFALVGGICAGLLKNVKDNIVLYRIALGLTLVGVFSSMSSGGWLAAAAAIAFIVFYRYRQYWKQALVGILMMCAAVEVVSNRHFYDVVDRVAFSGQTAWYRTRLFEVALFEGGMSGHWLTGYGLADPGWGEKIMGPGFTTDMVNQYLLFLCRFGLIGFIPFCLLIIACLKKLFENFWSLQREQDSWLIWCLAGAIFGTLVTFNSVSVFGQPMNMFYMSLGLCAALPGFSRPPKTSSQI